MMRSLMAVMAVGALLLWAWEQWQTDGWCVSSAKLLAAAYMYVTSHCAAPLITLGQAIVPAAG